MVPQVVSLGYIEADLRKLTNWTDAPGISETLGKHGNSKSQDTQVRRYNTLYYDRTTPYRAF